MNYNSVEFLMNANLEEIEECINSGDIELDTLVRIRELPEEFLSKFIDRINPSRIVRYQNVSENFIKSNIRFFSINDIKTFKHKMKIKNLVEESLRVYPKIFGI